MFPSVVLLGLAASVFAINPSVTPARSPGELFRRYESGCPTTGPLSCGSQTSTDSCCFESPGGLLLVPQFWDTAPAKGPTDSWTIHGLWPDKCDGTFEQSCDTSRAYTGIASILSAQAPATLAYMQTHWLDLNGQNEQFWQHEWAKHGTCMSTFQTKCLPAGSPRAAEAVAYFNTVVRLFKSTPTYTWLANAGITTSSSKTYTLAQIQAALKSASGVIPEVDCKSGTLNGVSFYYNLKGSAVDGEFVLINTPQKGSCPATGIKYTAKPGGSTEPTAPGTSAPPTPTGGNGGSLPAKGTIKGSTTGGLLSGATWSVQTLGTYTFSGTASSFTMNSSKGTCGVASGILSCGGGASSTFTAVMSGGSLFLASGGSTAWTSDASPSGAVQQTVYTGSSHAVDYTLSIVAS